MANIDDKDNPSYKAKVDAIGNIWVNLKDRLGSSIFKKHREKLLSTNEYIPMMGKNDNQGVGIRVDRKGNQIIGNYQPELSENFEGATINASKWTSTVSGFAFAQATVTGANLTNTASVASGAYSILLSQRYFLKLPRMPLQHKGRGRLSAYANSWIDIGFGIPATVTQIVPTGACIRVLSNTAYGVLTHNGSEVGVPVQLKDSEGNNIAVPATNDEYWTYDIVLDDDDVLFTMHDTENDIIYSASLNLPKAIRKQWSATSLPAYIRVVNSAVPATSPVLIISELQGFALDANMNRSSDEIAALMGYGSDRHPDTGANISNITNSTAPISATLSNTAAGYTTPDGNFQFAVVAGAETDYCLFGFQVPAGKKMIVYGADIDVQNMVIASATTETTFNFESCANGSAVSLATANFNRKGLGAISMPVGTAPGKFVGRISTRLRVPQVTESGRFHVIALRMPVGTATATEIIRGTIILDYKLI